MLADEPTANLDTAMSHEVIDLMRRLNEEKGATFFFATHDKRLLDRGPTSETSSNATAAL